MGGVNLRNCTEAFLNRSDVQALLAKTVYVDKVGPDRFVRVKTVGGDVYEQSLLPSIDLSTHEEMRSKFYDCAVPVVGEDRAEKIEDLVTNLEELQSVNTLTTLLQP